MILRALSRRLSITPVLRLNNPFVGNEADKSDGGSLQRRIVKHATFRERIEKDGKESYLYKEKKGTVLKSRQHWKVYNKWKEAEFDKVNILNNFKNYKIIKATPRSTSNTHAASVSRLHGDEESQAFGHALYV